MSKKRLFPNLDLAFEQVDEDEGLAGVFAGSLAGKKQQPSKRQARKVAEKQAVSTAAKPRPRRSSRKSFVGSLRSIFEPHKVEDKPVEKGQPKHTGGIDLLIQATQKQSQRKAEAVAQDKKRVTVIVDRKKLEIIKAYAKSEKVYLKDLFDRMMTRFLEDEGLF